MRNRTENATISGDSTSSPDNVPGPGSLPLLGTSLAVLALLGWRRKAAGER